MKSIVKYLVCSPVYQCGMYIFLGSVLHLPKQTIPMKLNLAVTEEVILNKIFEIRGKKVMLDKDLAELYQVETKQLKRQVRRNIERFPEDFMFELSQEEFENLRS